MCLTNLLPKQQNNKTTKQQNKTTKKQKNQNIYVFNEFASKRIKKLVKNTL